MELKNAKIKRIGEIKTYGDNGFKVVKFVVETTDEQYPQILELQCTQDKADNLIKFNKVGDSVDISFNLKGREWISPEGKTSVFNTIEAWKVFKADLSDDNLKKAAEVIDGVFPPLESSKISEVDDDLPF